MPTVLQEKPQLNFPSRGESRDETILESNRNLLVSTEAGTLLMSVYEDAVRLEPSLAEVEVVPRRSTENPRLGSATPAWKDKDGVHKVHIQLGPDALETASTYLKIHRESVSIVTKKMGLKLKDITPEILLKQVFLHELGHTVLYQKYSPVENDDMRSKGLSELPIPNVLPSTLSSPEASEWLKSNWRGISKRLGVKTYQELFNRQSAAYRSMPDESFCDDFATRVMMGERRRASFLGRLAAKLNRQNKEDIPL